MKNYLPKTKTIALFLLVLLSAFLPTILFAQDSSGFFSVPDTDVAKKQFIDYLAGPLMDSSQTSSPFGLVIGVFNGAVLLLGGIYLAYIYITGTAQGAHDGQFLGKRWSSMWVPIRMLIGAVLAFPSLTGGFCIAQWLVFWLALQGVGFANKIWTSYTLDPFEGASTTGVADSARAYSIAQKLFLDNVCIDIIKRSVGKDAASNYQNSDEVNAYKALFASTSAVVTKTPVNSLSTTYMFTMDLGTKIPELGITTTQSNALRIENALASGGMDPSSICGTAKTSATQQTVATNSDGSTTTTTDPTIFGGTDTIKSMAPQNPAQVALNGISDAFNTVHNNELNAMQTAIGGGASGGGGLAMQWLNNPDMDIRTALQNLANAYQDALNNTYKTSISSMTTASTSFTQSIQEDGWIMAGAYYMQLARMRQAISSAMGNYPNVSVSGLATASIRVGTSQLGHTLEDIGQGDFAGISGGETSAGKVFNMISHSFAGPYSQAVEASSNPLTANSPFDNIDLGMSNTNDGKLSSFISKIFTSSEINPNDIFSILGVSGAGGDPLFLAQNIGEKMLTWAWIIAGVGLVGGIFSSGIASLAMSLWIALSVPGATLTTVLPMLPFMIWMGSVFSWFVLLIEALIGAPLWAVAHLSPDGDGFQGGARSGYMLILNLTLRPALMIFGLIAAIIAMTPIGRLINVTYTIAFSGASASSTSMNRLTAIVAGCAIYALMMITTTKKVFELIHVVPERIMRWMGGQGDGLGHANEFGQGAEMVAAKGMQGLNAVGEKGIAAARAGAQGAAGGLARLKDKTGGNPNDPGNVQGLSASADKADMKALNSSQDDPRSNEKSAAAHMKLANGHTQNAMSQGKADSSFNYGMKAAQAQDAKTGGTAAMDDFLQRETEKAQIDMADGKKLKPHQESLINADAEKSLAGQQTAEAVRKRAAMAKKGKTP